MPHYTAFESLSPCKVCGKEATIKQFRTRTPHSREYQVKCQCGNHVKAPNLTEAIITWNRSNS